MDMTLDRTSFVGFRSAQPNLRFLMLFLCSIGSCIRRSRFPQGGITCFLPGPLTGIMPKLEFLLPPGAIVRAPLHRILRYNLLIIIDLFEIGVKSFITTPDWLTIIRKSYIIRSISMGWGEAENDFDTTAPGSKEGEKRNMSKKYPECPLYNHSNCRELHNPKLCAIVRKDKICLKKHQKAKPKKKRTDTD